MFQVGVPACLKWVNKIINLVNPNLVLPFIRERLKKFDMALRNKRMLLMIGGALVLLLLPLIAMQFTDEVVWTGTDFLIMGFMLLGLALMIEIILRKVSKPAIKGLLVFGAVLLFLLVWVELAVGIFGSPVAGS